MTDRNRKIAWTLTIVVALVLGYLLGRKKCPPPTSARVESSAHGALQPIDQPFTVEMHHV